MGALLVIYQGELMTYAVVDDCFLIFLYKLSRDDVVVINLSVYGQFKIGSVLLFFK